MLLTETQLHLIREIIADHHAAFVVNTIGPDAIPPELLQKLADKGLINAEVKTIEDAYVYGQLVGIMANPAVAAMSYEEFKQHVRKNPVPLSEIEKQAIKMAQAKAGQYAVGLGNKVDVATGNILIEADAALRSKLRHEIQTGVSENIARRETVKKLRSDLGWATQDWSRDWDRIAITEKHSAMQHGLADRYGKQFGPEVRVFKRPMPDACKHCKRLHLGPDGQPRIFKLVDLEENGSNFGKKVAEWMAVVGATHPHCQCQMSRIPPGFGFNEEGQMVPGGTLGQEYDDESDLVLAMQQEDDLQKAFALQGHVEFQGLRIAIENKVGSVRTWKDEDGNEGVTHMLSAYGYIKKTNGADGEEIDVFIGPNPRATEAYIVHQQNPATGRYDEDKCMLGFSSKLMAEREYLKHYDDPNFLLTSTPMEMETFKRWVGGTAPWSGELVKSGTVVMPHVIPMPLEKGRMTVESTDSQAGDRNVVHGHTGPNLFFNVPERPRPEPIPEYPLDRRDPDFQKQQDHARQARWRDKEDYFAIPGQKKAMGQKFVVDPDYTGGVLLDTEEVERQHEQVVARGREDKAGREMLIRKSDMKPVIAIGKHGGHITGHKADGTLEYQSKAAKKTGPAIPDSHWVAKLAKHYGGKVSPHKTDSSKSMLKLPKEKAAALEKFKGSYKLSGKIISGGKYAMMEINSAEATALAKVAPKLPEKKPPPKMVAKVPVKKKPPPPKPAIVPQGDVVGPTERLGTESGKFKTVKPEDMDRPTIPESFIQRGQTIIATIDGKQVHSELAGFDGHNRPVVMHKGKRRVLQYNEVKPVGDIHQRASYEGLPADAIVKLSPRQLKLMQRVKDSKVVGEHKAQEYFDYLVDRGYEAMVVGGLVRDMLAHTTPKSKETDDEVYALMMDVDIVTTASPVVGKAMFAKIAPEVQGKHGAGGVESEPSNERWGVIRAGDPASGIDLASMASSGTQDGLVVVDDMGTKEPPCIFDHDMIGDYERRDFTCNALYFDTHNNVIIDPTGQGIADAQNMVLRVCATPDSIKKNTSLPFRYFKFRARGYKPEVETRKTMVQALTNAVDIGQVSLTNGYHMFSDLRRIAGQKGDPIKGLKKLVAAMQGDGVSNAVITKMFNTKLQSEKSGTKHTTLGYYMKKAKKKGYSGPKYDPGQKITEKDWAWLLK